jgi:hypothetical protein
MFLLIGVFVFAIIIIITLQVYVFKKIPTWVSKLIVIIISFLLMATFTVHGIWLGIAIFTLGLLYLKFSKSVEVTK